MNSGCWKRFIEISRSFIPQSPRATLIIGSTSKIWSALERPRVLRISSSISLVLSGFPETEITSTIRSYISTRSSFVFASLEYRYDIRPKLDRLEYFLSAISTIYLFRGSGSISRSSSISSINSWQCHCRSLFVTSMKLSICPEISLRVCSSKGICFSKPYVPRPKSNPISAAALWIRLISKSFSSTSFKRSQIWE